MERNKKIVIVGATSAIAKNCARIWVDNLSPELILVGRDLDRLDRVVQDLKVRKPEADIKCFQAKFLEPSHITNLVDDICGEGLVDIVLIAHGLLPEQSSCQDDLYACQEALEVNAISPVLFAEAFAKNLQKNNHGIIALISSVAGDRGRKSNYIYGSAKALVSRYAEGLQHRFAGTNVKIILIKPGPTDTPMTSHLKGQGLKLADVEEVAMQITEGIRNYKEVIYSPRKWRLIMLVILHLPNVIFKKLQI